MDELSSRIFEAQFVPTEGGYIFFLSPRRGGVLVSEDERRQLLEARAKSARFSMANILALAAFAVGGSIETSLAGLDRKLGLILIVVPIVAWTILRSLDTTWRAPRHLIAGRPEIAPPRTKKENRRIADRVMTWEFILFALAFGGLMGGISLGHGWADWWSRAQILFWIVWLAACSWLAVRKSRSR